MKTIRTILVLAVTVILINACGDSNKDNHDGHNHDGHNHNHNDSTDTTHHEGDGHNH